MTDIPGLTFDHIGIAVRDPEDAAAFYKAAGYRIGKKVRDPEQNVILIYCTHDSAPTVELVSPAGEGSPVDGFLKESDAVLYHTGYRTKNIEDSFRLMKDRGFRAVPLGPAKPAVLFGGAMIRFFNVRGVGIIELIENL